MSRKDRCAPEREPERAAKWLQLAALLIVASWSGQESSSHPTCHGFSGGQTPAPGGLARGHGGQRCALQPCLSPWEAPDWEERCRVLESDT